MVVEVAGPAIAREYAVQRMVTVVVYAERMIGIDRVCGVLLEIAAVCSCLTQEIVDIEQSVAVDMKHTGFEVAAAGVCYDSE